MLVEIKLVYTVVQNLYYRYNVHRDKGYFFILHTNSWSKEPISHRNTYAKF